MWSKRSIAKILYQTKYFIYLFFFWFSLEEMKYLIFSCLRSGVEAEFGVEIWHSTRNASRIRRKVGDESFLTETDSLSTGFPLPTLLCVGYSVKLKKMGIKPKIIAFTITRWLTSPRQSRNANKSQNSVNH